MVYRTHNQPQPCTTLIAERIPQVFGMTDFTIEFEYADGSGREPVAVPAVPGDTLLDLALEHDVEIPTLCGGNCVCTSCHVWIQQGAENASPQEDDEAIQVELADHFEEGRSRLACQVEVSGPMRVIIKPD